jgi:hypothetical protein
MSAYRDFMAVMRQTRVIRFPKHRLATFGSSEIRYSLVSSLSAFPPKAMLRLGRVTAERPKILTPDAFRQRFSGFGDDQEKFAGWLTENYAEAFRGLEYTFRNTLDGTSSHSLAARELADNIKRDLDVRDVPRAAVIFGPEAGWQFSLMRFIVEETSQSFAANMRELEEHGLFDPEQAEEHRRRREIERLFREARLDASRVSALASYLKESRLFDQYQDRFFELVQGRSR